MEFISKVPIFKYFYPSIVKIADILIKIIHWAYNENFNDLKKSIDEFRVLLLLIILKNIILIYLSYEKFINYAFKFFNSFVEEWANALFTKNPFINLFQSKKWLLNIYIYISIYTFKKYIYKYVEKTIKGWWSDELV